MYVSEFFCLSRLLFQQNVWLRLRLTGVRKLQLILFDSIDWSTDHYWQAQTKTPIFTILRNYKAIC